MLGFAKVNESCARQVPEALASMPSWEKKYYCGAMVAAKIAAVPMVKHVVGNFSDHVTQEQAAAFSIVRPGYAGEGTHAISPLVTPSERFRRAPSRVGSRRSRSSHCRPGASVVPHQIVDDAGEIEVLAHDCGIRLAR